MIFDKKTGNYVKPSDPLGQQMDSLVHHSHVPDATLPWWTDPKPATPDQALHPQLNLTTQAVVADLDRIVRGRGEKLETTFVRERLRAEGHDPDTVTRSGALSMKTRRKIHNSVVVALKKQMRERNEYDMTRTYDMLLAGKDNDPVLWANGTGGNVASTVREIRAAMGVSVEDFLLLEKDDRQKVMRKVSIRLDRKAKEEERFSEYAEGRVALHKMLRVWSKEELRVERPSGSSLHHLLDYDRECSEGDFAKSFRLDDTQIVVVENDWGASVPPVEGEWRLPFPFMCWEFRISGVRVLCFTEADVFDPRMWMVYGAEGHWVIDDYFYPLGGGALLPTGRPHRTRTTKDGHRTFNNPSGDDYEMRRVADLCFRGIRSVCIMMDAEVVRKEVVPVPRKIAERRKAERRTPLRDHIVVRLVGAERRSYANRTRVAGPVVARSPQRGHWRKGTWVHYDDPDSGQVQYPNDGGFIVSKSWRKWHFAGDPRNILHKEYRA